MALDVVPSGDQSRIHFFQCVLYIFLISNTNDKSKLEKMFMGLLWVPHPIPIYI